MKAKKIKKMLNSGKYDDLTVAEFAKIVNEPEEFDVDKWADDMMAIFAPGWTPTKVTHYTNRKDK